MTVFPMSRTCVFCEEFEGDTFGAWHERFPGVPDRTLFATDSFVVLPSLGPIGRWHLLLVPRNHVTSLSQLPPHAAEECWWILERLRTVLIDDGQQVTTFEHGTCGTEEAGGCGIVHAHGHVVAGGCGIEGPDIDEERWEQVRAAPDVSPFTAMPQETSYLLFVDTAGVAWHRPARHERSQHLRSVVAARLGQSGWDWRDTGRDGELLGDLPRLRRLVRRATADSAIG